MAEKTQFIKVSKELQLEIATKFDTSTRSVQAALSFETKSPFARLIRSYALNHGGQLYEIRPVDNPYENRTFYKKES